MQARHTPSRGWPWNPTLQTFGGVSVLLGLLWAIDPSRTAAGLIAVTMNAIFVAAVVGGLTALGRAAPRGQAEALRWPLLPAAATLVLLAPMRLVQLAIDDGGPWTGLGESSLDLGFRVLALYLILAGVGWYRFRNR